jgi:DNA-binding transcriptional MerR regulator
MAAMNRRISKAGPWRIGELAKTTGVSTDTLRYYERKGALRSDRSSNGYREYPENAVERVRMIRQAMAVGFTLAELSTIFKVFDGGGAPAGLLKALAARDSVHGSSTSFLLRKPKRNRKGRDHD